MNMTNCSEVVWPLANVKILVEETVYMILVVTRRVNVSSIFVTFLAVIKFMVKLVIYVLTSAGIQGRDPSYVTGCIVGKDSHDQTSCR